jgi:hypothetical protein
MNSYSSINSGGREILYCLVEVNFGILCFIETEAERLEVDGGRGLTSSVIRVSLPGVLLCPS